MNRIPPHLPLVMVRWLTQRATLAGEASGKVAPAVPPPLIVVTPSCKA